MKEQLRLNSCACEILRYPEVFHVELKKSEHKKKLGFKFEKPANSALLELKITEVLPGGLLDEVNRMSMKAGAHHQVVFSGMRIEAVNEVEGDCFRIAEELRKNS